MLRRSCWRLEGFEAHRRRNQATRQLLWNPDGTLNIKGAAYYLWEWTGTPVRLLIGLGVSVYLYSGLITRITASASRETRECQSRHHERMRETGKLKSDRHLMVGNRTIEDPDYPDNLPGFGEGYRSRIMDDDEFQRASGLDERKYSH